MAPDETHDAGAALLDQIWLFLAENQQAVLKYAGSTSLAHSYHSIHQMRVSIKRLRSLYRWVEWMMPESFKARAELKELRKFFKAAGAVRDLQIRERLLESYGSQTGIMFPRYANHIRQQRLQAQSKLSKKMHDWEARFLNDSVQQLVNLVEQVDGEKIIEAAKSLVAFRNEEVAILFPPDNDADRLHKIRINLKENLYVMNQVNAAAKVFNPAFVDAVRKAGEIGGDWHDHAVLIEALEQAYTHPERIFPDERSYTVMHETVQADLKKSLKNYRKALKKLIDDYLHAGQVLVDN